MKIFDTVLVSVLVAWFCYLGYLGHKEYKASPCVNRRDTIDRPHDKFVCVPHAP